MAMDDDERLTASQLAARFGYTAGAVSNWRRRHRDTFPEPDAEGRYRAREVTAWLQQRGQGRGEAPRQGDVEQLLARARLSWTAQVTAAAMVVVQSRGADPQAWREWAGRTPELESRLHLPAGSLQPAFRAARHLTATELDELADLVHRMPARDRAAAFDALLDDSVATRADAEHVTTTDLTDLMVSVLPRRAHSVLDPACGYGRLLARAGHQVHAERLVGIELDRRSWAVAVQRMAVHDLPSEIRLADFFSELTGRAPVQQQRFDLVLAQPPLNQRIAEGSSIEQAAQEQGLARRRGGGDFVWLYSISDQLNDHGLAFVVTSAGATISSYDADLRRELVRRGSVSAVVALPGGLIAGTGVPVVLWALRSGSRPEDVLFINAEPGGESLSRGVQALRDWLYQPARYTAEPGLCKAVPVIDLLTEEAPLAPARWTEAPADPGTSRRLAVSALQRVAELRTAVQTADPPAVTLRPGPSVELITLETLRASGKLDIRRPWHISRSLLDDEGTIPYATRVTDDGLQVTGHLAAIPAKGAVVTEPGDVVLSTIGQPRAVVDETGGHVLGSSLWLVRPMSADPRFGARLLTLLLANPRIATQAIGGSVRRLRSPADVSIPMLREADAIALAEWWARMDALRQDAAQLARATEEAIRSVSSAVDAGASIVPSR